MKKLSLSKGFTLIELLVVITIIGILATGATAVYSTAQAKARDSNRITDAQVLQTAVEQSYSDQNAYPVPDDTDTDGTVGTLIAAGYLPGGGIEDAKSGLAGATNFLNYVYATDGTGGNQQTYEISTGFEAAGNIGTGSKSDEPGGNDDNRLEIGSNLGLDTTLSDGTTPTTNTADANATVIMDSE